MAKNIKQVYDANPSTTAANNDLIYLGKSPYGVTDDSAIKKSDLATQLFGEFSGSLYPKNGCRVATTSALTATYNNGTAGVGATLTNSGALAALSIDDVSLAVGDRVNVKDQPSQAQNGIFTVTNVGSGAVAWVLTRALDYNSASMIHCGDTIAIAQGTVNRGRTYIQNATGPFTVGTTAITFIFNDVTTFSPAKTLYVAVNGSASGDGT